VIFYLDANIVIYWVEGPPGLGARAAAHLAALRRGGHTFAVSDLTRLECLVKPLRLALPALLADFRAFFTLPDVQVLSLTADVCDRAAELRAMQAFKTPDALHLAAAIVHGCDRFLTNDTRLNACTAVPIDVLP
jgi:predicted nucleic acid-binding protein